MSAALLATFSLCVPPAAVIDDHSASADRTLRTPGENRRMMRGAAVFSNTRAQCLSTVETGARLPEIR